MLAGGAGPGQWSWHWLVELALAGGPGSGQWIWPHVCFGAESQAGQAHGSPACPGQSCQAAAPLPAVPTPVCCVTAQLFIDSRLYPGNRRMLTSILL